MRGTLLVGASTCNPSAGVNQCNVALGLGQGACADQAVIFGAAFGPVPETIATSGAIGDVWEDLPCLLGLSSIEYLYISSAPGQFALRFDPTSAVITTSAIPAGGIVAGSVDIQVTGEDGVGVIATVTFDASTNSPAAVVAAINAAFGALGAQLPEDGPIARLNDDDTASIVTPAVGPEALAILTDPGSLLGGDATANGDAQSTAPLVGPYMARYAPGSTAPTRIQASGNTTLSIVAAGTP